MVHVHVSRFSARSYELDSYRHLNNGVYLGWFEHARLEWLQSLGFSYDGFADRGQWIVVARTEVDFRLPLVLGDAVAVETRVESLGRSSVRFRQRMTREDGGAIAAEALTVMVFSGRDRRPVAVPDDFRTALGKPG
jgi:acyl-CoA thioester hydrolase